MVFRGSGLQFSIDPNVPNIPVNLNIPVQALSLGHNGGDTAQSNSSAASTDWPPYHH